MRRAETYRGARRRFAAEVAAIAKRPVRALWEEGLRTRNAFKGRVPEKPQRRLLIARRKSCHEPHQGDREVERRLRQIERGILRVSDAVRQG